MATPPKNADFKAKVLENFERENQTGEILDERTENKGKRHTHEYTENYFEGLGSVEVVAHTEGQTVAGHFNHDKGKRGSEQFENHRHGGRGGHTETVEHVEQHNVGDHHGQVNVHDLAETEILRCENAVTGNIQSCPLLKIHPQNTPIEAMISSVRYLAVREPMAEFRKFTASLLTPTQRSKAARTKRNMTIPRYIHSIKV